MALNAKIVQLLAETFKQKKSVFFSGNGLDISFQTHLLAIEADRVLLENTVKPQFIAEVRGSAKFYLQVRMLRFESETITSDGVHIVFPVSEKHVVEETRQAERFPFTDEERVICEIINPYDQETVLRKTVMDMSATGLSLRTTFPSELFAKDNWLPEIKVLIDGEIYTQGSGKVVYSRKVLDLKGKLRTQVGIKFEGAGPQSLVDAPAGGA